MDKIKKLTFKRTNAGHSKGHLIGTTAIGAEAKSNVLMYLIVSFFIICIIWASLAKLDKVTRGTGRVVPSQQMQIIQNLEGGIIKKILVREGQVVEAGTTLLILDKTTLKGQFNQGHQQELALRAKITRLTAEVNYQELKFDADLIEEAPNLVTAERQLFHGRKTEFLSQNKLLQSQIRQKQQELLENRVDLKTAKNGIALVESEINILLPLVENGLEPEINLLKLKRSMASLQGSRQTAEHAILGKKEAIQEARDRVAATKEKHRSDALAELSLVTNDMSELQQTLPILRDRVSRTKLVSPVRGIVNRILINTEGGVARPGEPLVEIVPLDDTLIVEANINPKDIAFLHVGQKAKIKITAYDFAKYGGLDGKLITISADVVQISDTETAYAVQAITNSSSIKYGDQRLEIMPGMVVELDILTGKQSIMEYILAPLSKVGERAFRE